MILPSKTIKPIDSIFCISSYVVKAIGSKELAIDEVYTKLIKIYPKKISMETLMLCFNFLFVIGKLESKNDIVKIKL